MGKRKILLACIVIGAMCGSVGVFGMASAESNLGYDVRITPSLLVTIPSDTVSLNLDPFTSAFGTASLPITVSTNNPTGFTLNMSASETDLTLVNGSETIPTLADKTGGYSESEFTANRWGYKLSTATNYLPFALSNELLVTDSPSNASVSTVNFASKVDATKPAGTYELTINFTAVANYVPPAVHTIADGGDMQEISSLADGGCPDTLTTGQAYTLTDSRDGESYKVARLADGNCWMLDNLALDLVAKKSTLTDANTNASTTTLNYLKNGGGSTSDQYATAAVSNWTSDYSYSAPLVNMASKDVVPTGAPTGGSGSNKVGGYYNYCAASAGSYCYGDGTSYGTSTGDATEDICPAGWRMPTGGSSGEYQALANAITGGTSSSLSGDDATNFKNALSTPLSGYFNGGSAGSQGSYGGFWSSTRYNDNFMYFLGVDSSNVYPQSISYRYYGRSVRCLLR